MGTSLPPPEGVRLIPAIGRLKLRTSTPVGGVSNSVTLTVAVPVVPQFVVHLFFSPLQELSASTPTSVMNIRDFFEFILTPHDRIRQTAPDGPDGWESPRNTLAPGRIGS